MTKYYAVKVGKKPGIYLTWDECKNQVSGFSGAVYKSFGLLDDAKAFINEDKLVTNVSSDGLVAYVDGSYNIDTCEYGYGCVLIYNDQVILEIYGNGNDEEGSLMRNVSGEIAGSIVAIEYAIKNNYPSIVLYYDYEGIEKWANGTWKTNKPGTIYYAHKVKGYRDLINISFVKVLAHSGNVYNDRADALAKMSVGVE